MVKQTVAEPSPLLTRTLAGAVALAVVAVPALEATSLPAGMLVQWPLYALFVIAMLWSLPLREAWLRTALALPATARWLLLALPVLGVLSAVIAAGPLGERLAVVAQYTGAIGLALAVPVVLRALGRHGNVSLLAAYTLGAMLLVFITLARYGAAASAGDALGVPGLLGMPTAAYLQWACWALPIVALAPTVLPSRRLRYLPHVVIGTLWTLVFFAGSVAALLSLAFALAFVTFWLPRPGRRLARLHLVAAIVGFAIYRGGYELVELLDGGRFSLAALAPSWTDALRTMAHNFLVGAGPGHYALAPAARAPNNTLIQFAAEWGPPAAIAALGLVALGLRAWLRGVREQSARRRDTRALVGAALTLAAVAALSFSLLANTLFAPASQLYGAVAVGWMLHLGGHPQETAARLPLRAHIALSVGAMLLLLVLVNALVQRWS